DIQNTLTHEVGHAVGMAHNPDDITSVMFPGAAKDETCKRELDTDDLAGLQYLYPTSSAAAANSNDAGVDGDAQAVGCSTAGGDAALWLALVLIPMMVRLLKGRSAKAAAVILAVIPAVAMASGSRRADAPAKDAAVVSTAKVVTARTLAPKQGDRLLVTEL